MFMEHVIDLRHWFSNVVRPIHTSDDVKVYVIDVLTRPTRSDLSKESIVLARTRAVTFMDHQTIGDWSLWIGAMAPDHRHAHVIETFGRLSYMSCHRLLRRQVRVYEQLADELPQIVNQLQVRLNGCVEGCNYESGRGKHTP